MKYRKYFRKIVIQKFPELYNSILRDTENRYVQIAQDTNFSKNSANPLDRRLDLMAYFLATIQALQEKRFDFQMIQTVCTEIALEYVRPKNRLQKWFKKLPPKLIGMPLSRLFLKRMHKKISQKWHEDGFRAELIMDKKETYGLGYGIDILECGICKLFDKHNAQEYTPILCEVDKITSNLAGLELIRKGTIANGADKCDFRFKKK